MNGRLSRLTSITMPSLSLRRCHCQRVGDSGMNVLSSFLFPFFSPFFPFLLCNPGLCCGKTVLRDGLPALVKFSFGRTSDLLQCSATMKSWHCDATLLTNRMRQRRLHCGCSSRGAELSIRFYFLELERSSGLVKRRL